MNTHELFMERAIQLAKLAKGNTSPNPLVGAVIVYQNKIIGEGYHEVYGGPHAEVNAVNSVSDPSILKDATIYVTLEPCAHHGKTPPCADLLIKHRFKQVFIGCRDPFKAVDGKGIEKIEAAGIPVELGVLKEECEDLNNVFFTYHTKKRPFVLLKWAETTNHLMSNGQKEGISWISNPEVQSIVHLWRSHFDAILIGKNTALADNPSLTVRRVQGKNPIRILLDSNAECPTRLKLFNTASQTIVLNTKKNEKINNIQYIQLTDLSPEKILEELYKIGIQSVFIEGGSQTLKSFIDANLWDEAKVITGQHSFSEGVKSPYISNNKGIQSNIIGDILTTYKNF